MVNLIEGLNDIRDHVFDNTDKGQLGTGGTAATENDTGLETPDATTLLDLTQKTKSTKSIKLNYELLSTGGTTTTYREFKLLDYVNSVDRTRDVFTGISFTNNGSQDLKITKGLVFRGL